MLKKCLLILSLFALSCGIPNLVTTPINRTPLPTLTPTPPFFRWDAIRVVRAIQVAGLESKNAHHMDPEEFGAIPALASQGIRFSIPSVCPNCQGTVLSFDDSAALESTKTYYTEATIESDPALSSWVFEKNNILLQLSGELPEAQALQYGTILINLDR